MLAGFALLVALRLPRAWIHGRFLDEEGVVFLAFAWHRPAGTALWRSFGGYLNLAANATTLLAARLARLGVLPLEAAPYLTMMLALACQMVPAMLILTGRDRWLAKRWAVVAALLVVAASPMTEEVFVNVLHIQFHLTLAAALVLALEVPRRRGARIARGILAFVAPLCGPSAVVLLPFFGLRALVDRDRDRLAQTLALAAGTVVQLGLFFVRSPVRGHLLDPVTLAAILFVRLAALPLTLGQANRIGSLVHASYTAGGAGWWCAAAGSTAYLGGLTGLALRDRRDAATWLIVPGLAVAAVSFGGGMIDSDPREWFSTGSGERYNFLPLVLVGLGLIVLASRPEGRYRRWCAGLCVLTLVSGAIAYRAPIGELRDGPAWNGEVAAWRRDHDHPLASWPKAWAIDLSDRDRPCSLSPPSGVAADPTYCEGSWLTRITRAIRADAGPHRPPS